MEISEYKGGSRSVEFVALCIMCHQQDVGGGASSCSALQFPPFLVIFVFNVSFRSFVSAVY